MQRKANCTRCKGPIEGKRKGKQAYCHTCHAEVNRLYRARDSALQKSLKLERNVKKLKEQIREHIERLTKLYNSL